MKKAGVLCVAFLAGVSMSLAAGQVGVFGSYWNNQDGDGGAGAGANFKLKVHDYIALEARATYFPKLSVEKDAAKADLKALPMELGILGILPLADQVNAYAGGGAGACYLDGEGLKVVDFKPSFYATAGLEFFFTESIGLFAEGTYRWCEWEVDEVLGNDTKGRLDGLGANAGLTLRW
jgi:hypothetical protein